MIVVVYNGGSKRFEYDTEKETLCLCPGVAEAPAIAQTLQEACNFLQIEPELPLFAPIAQ
jgi:hypothetical protein